MLTRKSPINCDNVPVGEKDKGSFRFMRQEHLKGRNEIKEVFGKGKRYGCRGAKLFVLKNELPLNRICFTFSRGFGNAVARNRARRLGREAFRLMKPCLFGGHDLILLVYPAEAAESEASLSSKARLSDRAVQLRALFTKAGLLK